MKKQRTAQRYEVNYTIYCGTNRTLHYNETTYYWGFNEIAITTTEVEKHIRFENSLYRPYLPIKKIIINKIKLIENTIAY